MNAVGDEPLAEFSRQVVTAVMPDRTLTTLGELELIAQLLAEVRRDTDNRSAIIMLRLHAHGFGHVSGEHPGALHLDVAWAAEQLATRLIVRARVAASEWNRLESNLLELRAQLRRRVGAEAVRR